MTRENLYIYICCNAITKYHLYIVYYVHPSSASLYDCPSSNVPKSTLQHITQCNSCVFGRSWTLVSAQNPAFDSVSPEKCQGQYVKQVKNVSFNVTNLHSTAYGLDGPRIESRLGRDFPHLSRPALRPTHLPVERLPGLSGG